MKLIKGDLWTFHDAGEFICVTTNGFVKANGCAVMGRGTAIQCVKRYPEAPKKLGDMILRHGNVVSPFLSERKILSFPVKNNWWEKADLELIRKSANGLSMLVDIWSIERVYLPKPGCGTGQLLWKDVKPILTSVLDDRFVVVELELS